MPMQYGGGTPVPKPPQKKEPVKPSNISAALTQAYSPQVNLPGAPASTSPLPITNWRGARLIDAYLSSYDSPLAGLGKIFIKKGKKRGIDPRLLVAIAGAETQFATDPNAADAVPNHNAWGMGPGIEYGSWREGIGAVANNLRENYFNEGLNTIPEIQGKWAPNMAANDPTGLNSNWTKNVGKFYNELVQYTQPKAPKLRGLSELIYKDKFYDDGQWVPSPQKLQDAHQTHAHIAATNPRILLKSLKWGSKRGLRFGENPYTDVLDGNHADQSYHYRNFPGVFGPQGKTLGQAFDVTDLDPNSGASLEDFFRWASNRYAGRGAFNYGSVSGSDTGGGSGVGGTSPGSPGAEQLAGPAGLLASQAMEGFGRRGRGRRSKDSEVIEQLLAALAQGQAGAQMMKGRLA